VKQLFIQVILIVLAPFGLYSQLMFNGYILDEAEQPHAYIPVHIQSVDQQWEILTNEHGRFELGGLKIGTYEVNIISAYGIVRKEIKLLKSVEMVMTIARSVKMDEVLVKSSRVDQSMPFTYSNINREQLTVRNLGQDVPYTLKWTPSIVVTSDAGTGIGYTGIRVRGSDPTRTNVTINGIPLNDAESQSVFWVNMPDFVSSTEDIQIQRGVGTSTNGAGAFGASINLNTSKLNKDAYAEVNLTGGSFQTMKGNLLFGSGLLNDRWTFDGRVSKIQSNGYIDRAEANLSSFYASVARYGHYSSLRLNVFHGSELTYQAWNGVPVQYIHDPDLRTYNSAGAERPLAPYDNEVDDYQQTHYQLLYHHQFNSFLRTNGALHYTRGKGFFEQYKADESLSDYLFESEESADLVRRRWLDNHFFGVVSNVNLEGSSKGLSADVGGAFHRYLGRHFGEVIWNEAGLSQQDLKPYYDNDATKNDGNVYLKIQMPFGNRLRGYFDLQQRWVGYQFLGLNPEGLALNQKVNHSFFNPKAGLNFSLEENKGSIYGSVAIAHKEPNRDDYTESTATSRPKAERLVDYELGYRYKAESIRIGLNGYYMQYKDQIVPTGQLNDVGAYSRENVDDSYRLGVEVEFGWQLSRRFSLNVQQTVSQNRINSFTEFVDNWDYWNQDFENTPPEELEPLQFSTLHEDTDLAFSPNLVSSFIVGYRFIEKGNTTLDFELANKYVGKQYLDNTSNERASLAGYFYSDARFTFETKLKWVKSFKVHFQLNNLFDQLYSANGWVYRFRSTQYDPRPDDPYVIADQGNRYNMIGLYPQAPINALVGLSVRF